MAVKGAERTLTSERPSFCNAQNTQTVGGSQMIDKHRGSNFGPRACARVVQLTRTRSPPTHSTSAAELPQLPAAQTLPENSLRESRIRCSIPTPNSSPKKPTTDRNQLKVRVVALRLRQTAGTLCRVVVVEWSGHSLRCHTPVFRLSSPRKISECSKAWHPRHDHTEH
jgi:hypothetical protein